MRLHYYTIFKKFKWARSKTKIVPMKDLFDVIYFKFLGKNQTSQTG